MEFDMAKKTTKTSAEEEVEATTKKATTKTAKVKVETKKDEATKAEPKPAKAKATAKATADKKADVKKKESADNKLKPEAKKKSPAPEVEAPVEVVPEVVQEIPVETKPALRDVSPDNVPNISNIRYSDEDLDMFAEVITEAKTEALDELRMLKERLEDLTSFDSGEESMIYSMHMAEQGSEAQEKEKTYAQIQRISEHIKKLEDAMDRIRNKTYGICRVCGCLIAKERLLAVPVTTLSAAYKIHSKCPEDGIDKIEPVKF